MPLFAVFAAVMYAMAFISIRYSWVLFLFEFLLAVAATVIAVLSITHLKSFISNVLTAASKRIFKDESRTIDDIRIPAVILGPYSEIIAANKLFTDIVCKKEDPLGDHIKKYLSNVHYKLRTYIYVLFLRMFHLYQANLQAIQAFALAPHINNQVN